ncbi:VPLPA-CTERM sorting domain-containing protein [Methylophaga lonarensis]|uniref:VPLPA-CTERM sorting domain-containing protein n=1 Tax=Methylophaga lonarensis TaxID=999151 RepID=UPI003D2CFDFA
MKIGKTISTMMAVVAATFSLTVGAATIELSNTTAYSSPHPSGNPSGVISTVVNINDYLPGAYQGYLVEDATPNALSQSHLQTALNAAGAGITVNDFFKIEPGPVGDFLDTSSLGLAFEGFLVKYSTFTMIGLFSPAITSLSYITHTGQDVSHIAFFNTSISEVPLPAAVWLFLPALMGFLGFRRRLTAA